MKRACPACGSVDVVRIVYGFPSPDILADAEAGKIHVGGCVVDGEEPHLHCKACEHDFPAPAATSNARRRGSRAGPSSDGFVGDLSPARKYVRVAIRAAIQGPGPLKIAVAYVTDDIQKLLGISLKGRDITLICDAWSGGCNPFVLRKLAKLKGVVLQELRGLHAKAIISDRAALVGSVNLSSSALVSGNIEALAVLRDPASVTAASAWFDSLLEGSKPLRPVLESKEHFQALLDRWTAQHQGGGSWRPTILEALEMGSPLLEQYRFELCYDARDAPSTSTVEKAAKTAKRTLPRHGTWTAYGEESSVRVAKRALEKTFVAGHKKQVELRVALDTEGRIKAFKRIDTAPKKYFNVIQVGRTAVSIFEQAEDPFVNFRGDDRATLCKRLTQGIAANRTLLASVQRRHAWLMTPDEVRTLLKAS